MNVIRICNQSFIFRFIVQYVRIFCSTKKEWLFNMLPFVFHQPGKKKKKLYIYIYIFAGVPIPAKQTGGSPNSFDHRAFAGSRCELLLGLGLWLPQPRIASQRAGFESRDPTWGKGNTRHGVLSLFLAGFQVFFFGGGSVHFYWGSAKNSQFFCDHTKSRDVLVAYLMNRPVSNIFVWWGEPSRNSDFFLGGFDHHPGCLILGVWGIVECFFRWLVFGTVCLRDA